MNLWYRTVYLKSEDWKVLRTTVINFSKGRCAVCNKRRKIEPHHIHYRRIWDVKIRDLVPICRPCHTAVHALLSAHPEWRKFPPYVRWFRFVLPLLDPKGFCRAYYDRLNTALTKGLA